MGLEEVTYAFACVGVMTVQRLSDGAEDTIPGVMIHGLEGNGPERLKTFKMRDGRATAEAPTRGCCYGIRSCRPGTRACKFVLASMSCPRRAEL